MTTAIKYLEDRSLIHDITAREPLEKLLEKGSVNFYCGFDPTADSLHLGSMLPLLVMRRLQRRGHKPIVLLGTATGMIGDPSGKSAERKLLTEDEIVHNARGIEQQVELFLEKSGPAAMEIVRNDEWTRPLSCIDFLRDVGKHFTVNMMMAKDSVRTRLEDREQGISYTEFSYMLLQAYDFYWLYQNRKCALQVGGSDQWGNITAGVELIRRKTQLPESPAYGLTFPLLTTASGSKFGKTEAGAVWLSRARTSPYRFYQYWLSTLDADVVRFIKLFTDIDGEELSAIKTAVGEKPEERWGQKRLAEELTRLVHGDAETARAIRASQVLFGEKLDDVDKQTLIEIFSDVPSVKLSRSMVAGGMLATDLLVQSGLVASKSEARRLIESGGAYLNNERIIDLQLQVGAGNLLSDSLIVLRSGKKKYLLVVME